MFLFWFIFFILILLRWDIFRPILGIKAMLLFDAVLGTVIGAWLFARQDSGWFNYLMGTLCLFIVYISVGAYVKLSEVSKEGTQQ